MDDEDRKHINNPTNNTMEDSRHQGQQLRQQFDGPGQPADQPLSYIDGVNPNLEQQANDAQPEGGQVAGWRASSPEEVVQVVYQSNPNGSLVGVETSLVTVPASSYESSQYSSNASTAIVADNDNNGGAQENVFVEGYANYGQPQPRSTSTLPSVAEESSSSAAHQTTEENQNVFGACGDAVSVDTISRESVQFHNSDLSNQPVYNNYEQGPPPPYENFERYGDDQQAPAYSGGQVENTAGSGDAIYSVVNKSNSGYNLRGTTSTFLPPAHQTIENQDSSLYTSIYQQQQQATEPQPQQHAPLVTSSSIASQISKHPIIDEVREGEETHDSTEVISAEVHNVMGEDQYEREKENLGDDLNAEIGQILYRQKLGAVESGSFKNNFRKKLGLSVSSNETDLTQHRQKFLEAQDASNDIEVDEGDQGNKFKRTHSVSFNVNSSRSNRHSVDIRNLPSYLTVKRASIVDIARGAMSSLVHSFGSGATSGASSSISDRRRDSSPDDEPIFEEPIAPTLSLGQRVALIKNSGAEFGTVGWIGQLPDVDDDWIVGVIFDNMIGNCDGLYNGVRYFYARENYAMFVPLSQLTKTDNYVGRPETGTMLSRMSVSLKPGQLISIQRSSIRLQHCFLNAPHQRVGHDVRAVSNRLHCQCHNCGPCAHLTKQSRINTLPHFGSHHIPKKKNSLAHAAVEILAHHHHHYHDEEEAHDEEDYQFGDNTAHACNFVRYSCCQQASASGHDFSSDCDLVRPELLDNLIHAPRAPHRRSRPRKSRGTSKNLRAQQQMTSIQVSEKLAIENPTMSSYQSTQEGTMVSWTTAATETTTTSEQQGQVGGSGGESDRSSSRSSSRSSGSSRRSSDYDEDDNDGRFQRNITTNTSTIGAMAGYQMDSSAYHRGVYNVIDSQMSLMDQRRFVSQRDSSAFRSQYSNTSDYSYENRSSLVSRIRRCFFCIIGRKKNRHHGRPKRRRTSMRNRVIEYRRKQSTFVPSTLAKPHEDFASHGIILNPPTGNQNDSNSDYSSYTRSSRSSSRSNSPSHPHDGNLIAINQQNPNGIMTMEHNIPTPNAQLKSTRGIDSNPTANDTTIGYIDYDDYSFSDRVNSYKKNNTTQDSALTDLGFCETCTLSSNDTLKSLVDKSINEEVSLPEPLNLNDYLEGDGIAVSPILSNDGNDALENLGEQVDISSLTVSCEQEDEICQILGCIDLDEKAKLADREDDE